MATSPAAAAMKALLEMGYVDSEQLLLLQKGQGGQGSSTEAALGRGGYRVTVGATSTFTVAHHSAAAKSLLSDDAGARV